MNRKTIFPWILCGVIAVAAVAFNWSRSTAAPSDAISGVKGTVFENYAAAVIGELQQRMPKGGECPMCKKNAWVVHEVPISIPVYENEGIVKFPGTSMPVAAMVCKNCGFMSMHSLGALGLIKTDKGFEKKK